jgi:hypothetical protein
LTVRIETWLLSSWFCPPSGVDPKKGKGDANIVMQEHFDANPLTGGELSTMRGFAYRLDLLGD